MFAVVTSILIAVATSILSNSILIGTPLPKAQNDKVCKNFFWEFPLHYA